MGTDIAVIMEVVDGLEEFFRGLTDGTVDEGDLEGLDEIWALGKTQLELILDEEEGLTDEDRDAIMAALEYLWHRIKTKAGELIQAEIDDPDRAILAADIAFAIGMAKSVLYWRMARR